MNITPLSDRILVKRLDAEAKTPGGIVLPDNAKEKPRRGTVLKTGPGKRQDDGSRAALQVKTGDQILFSAYAGNEVKVDGEEFLIMTEDDVLAVVESSLSVAKKEAS